MSTVERVLRDIVREIATLQRSVGHLERSDPPRAMRLSNALEVTISSGAIDAGRGVRILASEAGATDDLETINDGTDGKLVLLRAKAGHGITVKHNVGNIVFDGPAPQDRFLTNPTDSLFLVYNAVTSKWNSLTTTILKELSDVDYSGGIVDGDLLVYAAGSDTWSPQSIFVTAPANAGDPGSPGQIAYDGSFFYICVATDTWLRTAIATWP